MISRRISLEVDGIDVVIDGKRYFAIPAEDLDSTVEFEPESGHMPKPTLKRKSGKRAKKGTNSSASSSSTPSNPGIGDRILNLLSKKAETSDDILSSLSDSGIQPASIYATLSNLRKGGFIETKVDPSDGLHKNYKLP